MHSALIEQLFARDDAETEWWYYHGHLASGQRRFAFHLAFFRRLTATVRLPRLIQAVRFGPHLRFAHFAFCETDRREFHYGHRRSWGSDAGAANDAFNVWMRDWFARSDGGDHRIDAGIRGVRLAASLRPLKSPIHHAASGMFEKFGGCASHYVSYPRMALEGALSLAGESLKVTGEAWMDREAGNFSMTGGMQGWDWFGIQLDDGRELMIYRLRDRQDQQTEHSIATFISGDGSARRIDAGQITLTPLDFWTSRQTGTVYPLNWCVRIPELEVELQVRPFMPCHELDTRGSTSVIYWEGPADVTGTIGGAAVRGRSFVELVGYDRLCKRRGIYDFSTGSLDLLGGIANEFRLMMFGPGVRICDAG